MKPGDYREDLGGLIIREVSFKELCEKHDDLMLEYDIDDLWDAYKKSGPCWMLMKEGELSVVWETKGSKES